MNSDLESTFKEFADVKPVSQFSDEVKIIKIQYSKDNIKLMDIFRSILLSGEISLRVYNLTSVVISYYPTNYVAWVLRRKCLDQVKEIDLYKELDWLDDIMVDNQKNYQIWHHRKLLIDKLNDDSHEKAVLQEVFDDEQKNFHAWSHRIWMIRRFNNTKGEYDFIEQMLKLDIKNNSVWNYRFFLVLFENNNNPNKEIVEKEIKYAIEKIKKNYNNECPYCYIRGFSKKLNYKFIDFPFIKDCLNEIISNYGECSYGYSLLLDIYEEEKNEIKFNDTINKLIDIDIIRKKYYNWRKENSIFGVKNKK